eukprot:gene26864-4470_t
MANYTLSESRSAGQAMSRSSLACPERMGDNSEDLLLNSPHSPISMENLLSRTRESKESAKNAFLYDDAEAVRIGRLFSGHIDFRNTFNHSCPLPVDEETTGQMDGFSDYCSPSFSEMNSSIGGLGTQSWEGKVRGGRHKGLIKESRVRAGRRSASQSSFDDLAPPKNMSQSQQLLKASSLPLLLKASSLPQGARNSLFAYPSLPNMLNAMQPSGSYGASLCSESVDEASQEIKVYKSGERQSVLSSDGSGHSGPASKMTKNPAHNQSCSSLLEYAEMASSIHKVTSKRQISFAPSCKSPCSGRPLSRSAGGSPEACPLKHFAEECPVYSDTHVAI